MSESDRYKRIEWDEGKLRTVFVDAFLDSYEREPDEIVIDFDTTDDPIHGEQEGRFFQGYYDEYCFLPLYAFCGDHIPAATLRPADQDAEILSIFVDRGKDEGPHQAAVSSTNSPFLNIFPATMSGMNVNPCSFLQPFSASLQSLYTIASVAFLVPFPLVFR